MHMQGRVDGLRALLCHTWLTQLTGRSHSPRQGPAAPACEQAGAAGNLPAAPHDVRCGSAEQVPRMDASEAGTPRCAGVALPAMRPMCWLMASNAAWLPLGTRAWRSAPMSWASVTQPPTTKASEVLQDRHSSTMA